MANSALLFSLKVVTVQAINFFSTLLALSCDKIVIENAYRKFHWLTYSVFQECLVLWFNTRID